MCSIQFIEYVNFTFNFQAERYTIEMKIKKIRTLLNTTFFSRVFMVENIKMRNFAHVIVPHWMVVVRKKNWRSHKWFHCFFSCCFLYSFSSFIQFLWKLTEMFSSINWMNELMKLVSSFPQYYSEFIREAFRKSPKNKIWIITALLFQSNYVWIWN